jgi:1-acyl-sn-glycerol-3-phosphate acyltransferase
MSPYKKINHMKCFIFIIYQFFIWLPLFLLATVVTALVVIVGCLCGGERIFSYYPGAWWAKFTCIITLCPVKVVGREKLSRKQSYIFVSNHQGAYDIFLIYGYIGQPIKWVMKQSLRRLPLVGKACESAGFIFVDNSSPKAAAKTIRDAETKLKNGASIAIFPEGSRSRTGQMGKFKKGAYQMAIDLQLPVVPITINGSYEVMPIGSRFIRPHKMELIIHDPIPAPQVDPENIREAALKIRYLVDKSFQDIKTDLWEKYK